MSDTKPPTVNFAKLIGPPALLPGEDATQYEALRAEVRKCFDPKRVLDEANVSDVTDKIWEAQRYKRFEVRILEGSRLSALAHLLLPLFQSNSFGAFVAAGEYFGRDSQKSKRIKNLMDEYNITEEMVYAKAASMDCGKISYIERMISAREKRAIICCESTKDGNEGLPRRRKSAVPRLSPSIPWSSKGSSPSSIRRARSTC